MYSGWGLTMAKNMWFKLLSVSKFSSEPENDVSHSPPYFDLYLWMTSEHLAHSDSRARLTIYRWLHLLALSYTARSLLTFLVKRSCVWCLFGCGAQSWAAPSSVSISRGMPLPTYCSLIGRLSKTSLRKDPTSIRSTPGEKKNKEINRPNYSKEVFCFLFSTIQFYLYIEPNHRNSCLKALF